ncbi:MAG: hydantoinase/oxoprolinase family protein [Hyphomicrobiaceae bacterium]|jgi:N-methylhydantoinase A
MLWVGVDVGGTFTDLVVYDDTTRRLEVLKTPSTPHDQSEGIFNGLGQVKLDARDIARFVHGTTVATNTALERNGARMAVLVTAGHRDVLIVGRGNRTVMYDIKARGPEPIVRRDHCIEVDERMGPDGRSIRALDEGRLAAALEVLRARKPEAVAVCFLHAYANPVHEQRAAELVRAALPDAAVSLSSEVLPEYREHERFITTALNAYVAPRMRRYLASLRRRLGQAGSPAQVSVMTSNGGVLPDSRIEALPVVSMLSGPAAGVTAACAVGAAAGFPNLIAYDMGGTSTDVCLIRNGAYGMASGGKVGAFAVKVQQIDINSVGAGGGSIAALSDTGVLSVGPRSAGALPGPACYGRGGTEPTVTDANVALGRLGVDAALGGEIRLDRARAEAAVAGLAGRLGLGVNAMAEGIIRIAVANMATAIKEVSVMRGLDPRDFALLAYGGAGPLHAVAIAEELGMGTVLVPPMPGNFSAFGLLIADLRRDFVATRVSPTARTEPAIVNAMLAQLAAAAHAELAEAGIEPARRRLEASLDMRYLGQAFELSVPVPLEVAQMSEVEAAFRGVYADRYGAAVDAPSEIVSYRLIGWGRMERPELPKLDGAGRSPAAARIGARRLVVGGAEADAAILAREAIPLDARIAGPAIIEEAGATTLLPPSWSARLEPSGSLVLERQ